MIVPKLTPQQIAYARREGCGSLAEQLHPEWSIDLQFELSQQLKKQVWKKEISANYRRLERQADRIGNYGRIRR